MVRTTLVGHDRDMTETQHDTAGTGGQGPRVPPAQMRDLNRLRRSTTDRKIAGVAGGIGRHLDIDPTIVRVLLVVMVFFGGAGLLVYGATWLFVPEDGSDEAPIRTSGETRTLVLVVALVIAGLLLLSDGWWFGFNDGWPAPLLPLLVVGLVVWLLVRNRGRRTGGQAPPPPPPYSGTTPHSATPPYPATYAPGPGGSAWESTADAPTAAGPPPGSLPPAFGPPPPPASAPPYLPPPPPAPRALRERSLFGITMAFVLLGLGAVAVVELAGNPLPWAVYPATALTVIGLGLLAAAFVGRGAGLAFTGVLTTAVLAVAVWAPELEFGDVDAHPTSAAAVQDSYAYTAGRIHLDLTGVQDLEQLDGRVLDLRMRAGEVIVELPDGLDVDVSSEARGGQLVVLGNVVEGRAISNDQATPDTPAPDLRINLDMGFGHARVSTP